MYVSHTSCAAYNKPCFMLCTRAILCVLHDSKKHMSQTSCAVSESPSCVLRASCLPSLASCIRIKAYNEMAHKQNIRKHVDMQKIAFLKDFLYRYSNLLWMTLYPYHLNTKHNNGTRFGQHDH